MCSFSSDDLATNQPDAPIGATDVLKFCPAAADTNRMDASIIRALTMLRADPWSWAHGLERAGLPISLIADCRRAGLSEFIEAYPWSWTNDKTGEQYSGHVMHAKLTAAGHAALKAHA
jgi:hypothetical protein